MIQKAGNNTWQVALNTSKYFIKQKENVQQIIGKWAKDMMRNKYATQQQFSFPLISEKIQI